MDVLVTYDIETYTPADHRRLQQVAHICEGFGLRIQYSVFECRVSDVQLEELLGQLLDVIDTKRDSVNVYQFHGDIAQARRSLGRSPGHSWGEPFIH